MINVDEARNRPAARRAAHRLHAALRAKAAGEKVPPKRKDGTRPPPRLFSADDVRATGGDVVATGGAHRFAGQEYQNGLLVRDFKLDMITVRCTARGRASALRVRRLTQPRPAQAGDVHPTLDEIQRFEGGGAAGAGDGLDEDGLIDNPRVASALAAAAFATRSTKTQQFDAGDEVEVIVGDLIT